MLNRSAAANCFTARQPACMMSSPPPVCVPPPPQSRSECRSREFERVLRSLVGGSHASLILKMPGLLAAHDRLFHSDEGGFREWARRLEQAQASAAGAHP